MPRIFKKTVHKRIIRRRHARAARSDVSAETLYATQPIVPCERAQTPRAAPGKAPALAALSCALLAFAHGAPCAPSAQPDRQKAEAELQAIKTQINQIATQVNRDQLERDRLTRELRAAEIAVGSARDNLERVKSEHAQRSARRAVLAQEQHRHVLALANARQDLANELRAAYLIDTVEPLKLLLNQQDPASAGRMFVYYSYFARAHAREIDRVNAELGEIARLDQSLSGEESRLQELETERHSQLSDLQQAQQQRSQVLLNLQAESRNRVASLDRLQHQKTGLQKLLHDLQRVVPSYPANGNDAFSGLRGKLAWPVNGHIVTRFGDTRAGAIKWDGLRVATERGTAVHAISDGRVIYADWLSGLGLLAIIDHGNGYLSLYGHNDRLLKGAGEHVAAGDAIGTAGDSGGADSPELYFEIRKAGKPVDPRPWFATPDPHP
jgi:septal ring factor EnvC (AmiA/AmiB activator)